MNLAEGPQKISEITTFCKLRSVKAATDQPEVKHISQVLPVTLSKTVKSFGVPGEFIDLAVPLVSSSSHLHHFKDSFQALVLYTQQ